MSETQDHWCDRAQALSNAAWEAVTSAPDFSGVVSPGSMAELCLELAVHLGKAGEEIDRLRAELKAARAALGPVLGLPVECVNSLTHQRQIDRDGCEVGICRQAVDEIYAALLQSRASLPPVDGGGE